jgi:Carbamoyltransferase C-terminus
MSAEEQAYRQIEHRAFKYSGCHTCRLFSPRSDRSQGDEPAQRFEQLTGCPVLVNTSFNVRGEPIVCTPEDAFTCFMGTGIEFLAIGNCILRKDQQNLALARDYKHAFALD